ncbi:MAG: M23 family metallopeptidase [Thermoanaerobacteraceae bacterium]|nr:M23 family metallopeptidase [Thermoanaerobacteraceae bacterium]
MAAPAWLVKLGKIAAQDLAGTEAGEKVAKAIAAVVSAVIAGLLSLLIAVPSAFLHIPAVEVEEAANFMQAVKEVSETTVTDDDPEGVEIPWKEVTAVAGVLYHQDFSGVSEGEIKRLARYWIEKHEKKDKDVWYDEQGKKHVDIEIITWYTLRSMGEVLDELNFSKEDKEITFNYLRALNEGGMRPPRGWKAVPRQGWCWPVPGYDKARDISSAYGFRVHPIDNLPSFHRGVDIVAGRGTIVVSAKDGIVQTVGEDETFGRYLVIESGLYTFKYAHLQKVLVSEGEQVELGDVIGRVGNTGKSTGPHLHFEVKFLGEHQNPLNFF